MHLALFLSFSGSHLAGWRHPLAEHVDPFDIGRYAELAARAEAAKLDMLFVADTVDRRHLRQQLRGAVRAEFVRYGHPKALRTLTPSKLSAKPELNGCKLHRQPHQGR